MDYSTQAHNRLLMEPILIHQSQGAALYAPLGAPHVLLVPLGGISASLILLDSSACYTWVVGQSW